MITIVLILEHTIPALQKTSKGPDIPEILEGLLKKWSLISLAGQSCPNKNIFSGLEEKQHP